MREDQALEIIDKKAKPCSYQEDKEQNPTDQEQRNSDSIRRPSVRPSNTYRRWLWVAVLAFFVIAGQAIATLVGRLYFDGGGKSSWMQTLVQLVGFPILIPFYFFSPTKEHGTTDSNARPPSPVRAVSVYAVLGLLYLAVCYLYSIGLHYLPVSTFSLITASQLAFNAAFSYFLNSQKLTPFILNSVLLLTISSALLAFNNEETDSAKVSKAEYITGFICTIGSSAAYGLYLSLQELTLRKILKRATFSQVMEMIIYMGLISSCACTVGLFASGEWKTLTHEMQQFKTGKVSYIMNLVWTTVAWQLFTIGGTGLIFELSALFSNAINAVGLPVIPILAVFIFHDKMNGLKVIAMVLALWGFASYVYQNYVDDKKK